MQASLKEKNWFLFKQIETFSASVVLACPPRTSLRDRPGDRKPEKAKGENREVGGVFRDSCLRKQSTFPLRHL